MSFVDKRPRCAFGIAVREAHRNELEPGGARVRHRLDMLLLQLCGVWFQEGDSCSKAL